MFRYWAELQQNLPNNMCAKQRLRLAWATAQSVFSPRCAFCGWPRTQTSEGWSDCAAADFILYVYAYVILYLLLCLVALFYPSFVFEPHLREGALYERSETCYLGVVVRNVLPPLVWWKHFFLQITSGNVLHKYTAIEIVIFMVYCLM